MHLVPVVRVLLIVAVHRYSIYAGLGLSAGMYLYKHSRLAGSNDLDEWARVAAAAAKGERRCTQTNRLGGCILVTELQACRLLCMWCIQDLW